MFKLKRFALLLLLFIIVVQCKQSKEETSTTSIVNNSITNASGLAIYDYKSYSVVKILTPWPNASKPFTYILAKENAQVPDSLQQYKKIQIPLKNIVVTSTTNVPFLEILGVENKLVGFPHTDYISSLKTRKLIDNGNLKNLGENEKIDIEKLIDLAPSALVSFGVDGNNPTLNQIEQSGIPVLIQADWMEQSPLGKAEWIKFFGALFGKEKEAQIYFEQVKKNYNDALELVKKSDANPKILYGSLFQDQWFMPRGDSWISQYIKDARGNYLWSNLKGVGSEPLTFEQVFDTAKNADIWITTGSIIDWKAFGNSNKHYTQFESYKNKKVYTFEWQKGATGGVLFFEFSPSQPDKVIKDYIKIIHPELLPNYSFSFAKQIH